jgi:hypothetical protein
MTQRESTFEPVKPKRRVRKKTTPIDLLAFADAPNGGTVIHDLIAILAEPKPLFVEPDDKEAAKPGETSADMSPLEKALSTLCVRYRDEQQELIRPFGFLAMISGDFPPDINEKVIYYKKKFDAVQSLLWSLLHSRFPDEIAKYEGIKLCRGFKMVFCDKEDKIDDSDKPHFGKDRPPSGHPAEMLGKLLGAAMMGAALKTKLGMDDR